ncbi:MAG: hypothetical protein IJM35_07390 [Bacteroidales bacterium]|nr:hypothetical protein [Bacteroidales bacterium]
MNKLSVITKLCKCVLVLVATAGAWGCDNKPSEGAPVIKEVRRSTGPVTYASRGNGIQIVGSGLGSTKAIRFNGYEANINTATIEPNSILIVIPYTVPTIEDQAVNDLLEVETKNGVASVPFVILPKSPSLTDSGISIPAAGEVVTLTGNNLYYVQYVSFPGETPVQTTQFEMAPDGQSINVTVPEGYDPLFDGYIEVCTLSGIAQLAPPQPPLEITELKYVATVNAADWEVRENLQTGDVVYVDRTAVFGQIPEFYQGSMWISTATNSRAFNKVGETLASFKVNRKTDVFIARNQGTGATIEEWLSGWEAMPRGAADENYIGIGTDKFWMYKKTFPGGSTVEVGRNGNTGRSPYFIILK